MTHDELVDTGAQAMHFLFVMPGTATNRGYAAAVVEAVEPLIRAAERDRIRARTSDALSGLRAQVEALPPGVRWDPYQDGNPDVVLRAAVLALLDGTSDE